eukprot:316309-Chlamydomonas_euryale.AAC.3
MIPPRESATAAISSAESVIDIVHSGSAPRAELASGRSMDPKLQPAEQPAGQPAKQPVAGTPAIGPRPAGRQGRPATLRIPDPGVSVVHGSGSPG